MHAETVLVLLIGVFLLAAGSLSLLVVRITSPGLHGVGFLSLSFAAGSVGAGCLLIAHARVFSLLLADLALLSSFILLHLAVLQLTPRRRTFAWPALAFLLIQALVDVACLARLATGALRVEIIGVLVAVQAGITARELWSLGNSRLKAPAAFCTVLLVLFGGFNLCRSVLVLSGLLSRTHSAQLSIFTFLLYIAVALGLAFGFFWTTTASLTVELEHVASTDPLTRVANRRLFLQWCEKEMQRSQRTAVPFSLLMLDLDHFKYINDNFGHQRGDEVLVAAVERMQDSIRGIDVLCRWGGEEFAVLLPNASENSTKIVAERIRENILRMAIDLGSVDEEAGRAVLTASIGTATYLGEKDSIPAILLRADRALYRAKSAGRNQVLVAV